MEIAVSESLAHLHHTVVMRDHTYDVSIILESDRASWMDRSFRSIHPHFVRSEAEAEYMLTLYKEYDSEKNRRDSGDSR